MPIESLVAQHLKSMENGDIDKDDFLSKVSEKCKKIQKRFSPFITIRSKIDCKKSDGLLSLLPISIKDNICTKGLQTTAGSRILEGYIPPFDATCVEKVKGGGGIILGKTAMDEFGFGTFSVNCGYEIPKNPLDIERSCGGSSGGAACLTASADFPHIAIAESTGGSITCPAAFTGTVGLTPTYGRVSRWGLISFANSLDKIGIISKCVYDSALLLSVMAGKDKYDSTVLQKESEDFTKHLNFNFKGIKIGVPEEYFSDDIDVMVKGEVWRSIKKLESEGADYEKVSLPNTKHALPASYIIAMSEASTNLSKYCGMRYGKHDELKGNFDEYFSRVRSKGFGEEAKRRIILGTFARMSGYRDAYYLKALKIRTRVIEDFKKAFKRCDVLMAPSMPILSPKFKDIEKLTPVEHYMTDTLTYPPNLAGIPMLSVPCGFVNGLPVGLHIMSDHWQEGKMLQVGYSIEKVIK